MSNLKAGCGLGLIVVLLLVEGVSAGGGTGCPGEGEYKFTYNSIMLPYWTNISFRDIFNFSFGILPFEYEPYNMTATWESNGSEMVPHVWEHKTFGIRGTKVEGWYYTPVNITNSSIIHNLTYYSSYSVNLTGLADYFSKFVINLLR